MSPTEEVPEKYLKNMFMMPSNYEFCCPSCYVRIDKVFFRTARQPIVPLVTNPPLEPADTEPQVIERDEDYADCLVECSTCNCLLLLKDNQLILVSLPISTVSDDLEVSEGRSAPDNVECLVRCVIGFMLVIKEGKEFITGLVSGTPEPEEISINAPFREDSTSHINVTPEIGIVIAMNEHDNERQELYLERVFQKPPTHGFYCPNCKYCIQKVYIQKYKWEHINCIVPRGRWELCGLASDEGKKFITGLVSRVPEESRPRELSNTLSDLAATKPPPIITTTESSKGWEVLKSIVYGGLAESLASLSVVTSAASADAATLSILTLGTANLIGGLTILTYNLRDLKASQPREEESEREGKVERYYELLGKRENFFMHVFFAILSLLIFGLVPPIVYGFSFRESDDKDMKLAAVAGASLICITLLAIAKAQTQRPNNTFITFFKTVTFYVTSGVLASLLTYVAGAEMKKLVEQLGWFQPKTNFGLSLPHVSVENYGWGSY